MALLYVSCRFARNKLAKPLLSLPFQGAMQCLMEYFPGISKVAIVAQLTKKEFLDVEFCSMC
jgi:hypothetical protein